MPRPTDRSSSTLIPALELSVGADERAAAVRHADDLVQWRAAAEDLARAYEVWCAASWGGHRRRCFLSFVDAFIREETIARRVQHSASALNAAQAGTPRRCDARRP